MTFVTAMMNDVRGMINILRTQQAMSPITRIITAGMLAAGLLAGGQFAIAQSEEQPKLTAEEKEAERKARLKLAADGLEKLYRVQPEVRQAVEKAPGYAVFDVTSLYAIMFVGQKGKGVLFDNATKKSTYMLSNRAGTGPGVGKQRVYQIFVFKSKGAMDQFVLAGGLGGDVGASFSTGKGGSVRSFNPNIDIYQIPESGMAVQASWGGTVYSVDTDLK
jgi:lipid-binding SYLF domain-containing protein